MICDNCAKTAVLVLDSARSFASKKVPMKNSRILRNKKFIYFCFSKNQLLELNLYKHGIHKAALLESG